MALFKRSEDVTADAISGRAGVDERTKNLVRRLKEGEIAVINHADLDRVAAEQLVQVRPAAVLNAAKSTTGRYPNLGPGILIEAGIPLIDDLGPDIMAVHEGDKLRVQGNQVFRGNKLVAEGEVVDKLVNDARLEAAKEGLTAQIDAFAENTLEYLRRERDLLISGVGVPDIRTELGGKQVLVVVRGYSYKEDLKALRAYIREYHPVLIGVDGGADALIEAGYKPNIIIGDMDSVSDDTLRCGAEIIVHAYRDGRAPGVERLNTLGLEYIVFPAAGTSEDIALLLADAYGADLIVALGTHATLTEFLDKGRAGMASTFLTRLRVGTRLVDAKGVSELYRPRVSTSMAVIFGLVGILAVVVALAVTPTGRMVLTLLGSHISDLWDAIRSWF